MSERNGSSVDDIIDTRAAALARARQRNQVYLGVMCFDLCGRQTASFPEWVDGGALYVQHRWMLTGHHAPGYVVRVYCEPESR